MKRLILLIILLVFPMTSYAFDSAYTGAQVDAEIARGIGRNLTVGDPGSDAELVTEQAVREALDALSLGTAATRNAEDTMTDGSNLPDGAAVKTYGDAHWGGAGTLVFKTHDVPQGTDPVADLTTDTLQWLEGEGIDITGDSAADSITIKGEDATSANKGVASFNATRFSVVAGAVDIATVAGITGANEDDVTLVDVQGACTNDFHNIGGTDDDVPDAGDFGAAEDLTANGALNTGCVAGNELASTAVIAGSYTSTNLTVDDDGRITAAANGAGGSLPAGNQGDMLYKGSAAWLALDGIYNVKAYGAVGDGSTNDQAAIQLAVNAALNHTPQAGTVYFPDGKYKVNTTINVTASGIAASNLLYFSMVGNSPGSSLLYTARAIPIITVDADYEFYYGTFSDLGFAGTSTAGQYGIYFVSGTSAATGNYINYCHFSRLKFMNLKKGFYFNRTTTAVANDARMDWNTFESLIFQGVDYGIHIVNGSGTGNVYNGGNYVCSTAGIKIDGTNGEIIGDITFANIQFGASGYGIHLNSSGNAAYKSRFTITSCQMDANCLGWNLNGFSEFIIDGTTLGGNAVPVMTSCTDFTVISKGRSLSNWTMTSCSDYMVIDGNKIATDADTSSDWWTTSQVNMIIENMHATGDGILKLTGATTGIGRIVYGKNGFSDKLIFSSRKAAGTTAKQIRMDNNANLWVGGNITAGGNCCVDYVFEKDYELMPLNKLQDFIREKNHLPGITIGTNNRISLVDSVGQLLEKTEEQALYILQLHKRVKTLEARLN